ncbi:SDR family NAD(P)-dependent oxidoreductase [Thalassococcus arenae]|uniref:SDR family NAD(P)-dependent oxidoreductase n=1 Tax=Thalassococcus arenae TaxID=2851652 RepID=UPI0032AEAC9D
MTRFEAVVQPGGVAVVTGAALGIGRALARDLAARGMRVVMVDSDAAALAEAADDGAVARVVDVADRDAMQALSSEAAAMGPVRLVVNNAVTRVGRGFDAPLADWRRAVDVNLFGVIHGVRAFLPVMAGPGMIVNVGSKQGITNPPGHRVYNLTKAAVKSFTEGLEHDLRGQGGAISAHLLIPGWTTTGRAAHKPGAWQPEQVVERLIQGLTRGDFYILCPDGEVTEAMDRARILWAAGDITENRPALSRWHDDWKDVAAKACS